MSFVMVDGKSNNTPSLHDCEPSITYLQGKERGGKRDLDPPSILDFSLGPSLI